jgi:hypothetical protein
MTVSVRVVTFAVSFACALPLASVALAGVVLRSGQEGRRRHHARGNDHAVRQHEGNGVHGDDGEGWSGVKEAAGGLQTTQQRETHEMNEFACGREFKMPLCVCPAGDAPCCRIDLACSPLTRTRSFAHTLRDVLSRCSSSFLASSRPADCSARGSRDERRRIAASSRLHEPPTPAGGTTQRTPYTHAPNLLFCCGARLQTNERTKTPQKMKNQFRSKKPVKQGNIPTNASHDRRT